MTDSDHIMQLRQQVANLHASLAEALAQRDEERRKLRKAEIECSMLRVECGVISATLDDVRRERDEARRQVSKLMGGSAEQHWYANRLGWDCFKENP